MKLVKTILLLLVWLAAPTPVRAAYDFVRNGDFTQGLTHWSSEAPAGVTSEIRLDQGELRLGSGFASDRQGIRQKLDVDVSRYRSLLVKTTVRVDEARLPGTGLHGLEAPAAVWVSYTDAQGVLHEPGSVQGAFWRGFYFLQPNFPYGAVNGIHVPRGVWQEYEFDLMTLSPPPRIVHFIGLAGSGWARRDARFKNVSLVAPEEGREYVGNTRFTQLASGWQVVVENTPAEYQAELTTLTEGIRLESATGSRRIGLRQLLEVDVSLHTSLRLTAEVRVDRQSLGGTGWQGDEAPLALFVTYTDAAGRRHDQPLQTGGQVARFWRGFFTLHPQPPLASVNGVALTPGEWATVSFELMNLQPKPVVIHSVGVESAGRPPRSGTIRMLSLKGY